MTTSLEVAEAWAVIDRFVRLADQSPCCRGKVELAKLQQAYAFLAQELDELAFVSVSKALAVELDHPQVVPIQALSELVNVLAEAGASVAARAAENA